MLAAVKDGASLCLLLREGLDGSSVFYPVCGCGRKHSLPKEAADGRPLPPDALGMAVVTSGAWEHSRSYEISPVRPRAGLELGAGEQGLEREI